MLHPCQLFASSAPAMMQFELSNQVKYYVFQSKVCSEESVQGNGAYNYMAAGSYLAFTSLSAGSSYHHTHGPAVSTASLWVCVCVCACVECCAEMNALL